MKQLLLLLALAGCLGDEALVDTDQAAITGFVRATVDDQGRPRFIVDGKRFRFIGANMNELPWLDPEGQSQELRWARDAGLKVLRVWAVDEAEGADQMAARLRGLLDRAAASDVYVTIALTHNYRQTNWVKSSGTLHAVPGDARPNGFTSHPHGFYTRPCGSDWCLDDSWLDWGYNAHYSGYALRLVELLRDHPAVFAWDIANEVSGSTRDNSWVVGRVTDFYVDMANRIRAVDPNHMITTGLISTSWVGMTDAHRDRVYRDAPIDFLTVHEYEEPLNNEGQNDEVWRGRNRYRKPVVIEEYGGASTSSVAAYYRARLSPADPALEATGIMYWGVASSARDWMTDDRWSPRALGAYDWFLAHWRGWATTLANESGGGGGGACIALSPNQSLGINGTRSSCDGTMTLVMQGDGNLVLYANGGGPLWASCTSDRSAYGVFMQGDGNLVLYAPGGARWNSRTAGNAGARLVFEPNRLALRSASGGLLWSSTTWCQ